jgi:hypothetical protein
LCIPHILACYVYAHLAPPHLYILRIFRDEYKPRMSSLYLVLGSVVV